MSFNGHQNQPQPISTSDNLRDCDIIINNQRFSPESDEFVMDQWMDDRGNDLDDDDELPICQSYSDMEESLRAQHRHSFFQHWLLHWFHRRFIQILPEDSFDGDTPAALQTISHIQMSTSSNLVADLGTQATSDTDQNRINKKNKMQWCLNYLEASIYLEEGLNNDKFEHHPHSFIQLPMYLIAHNRVVYAIDLLCCWLILSLALAEKPAVDRYHLPATVHATIELIGLTIIAIILLFKYQWIGGQKFFKHQRSLIKTLVLVLMIIEALVVLGRQDSHFRVTRSLRPMFLIDNFHCFGVRRVIRQTFQSLRSFFDMLSLLMFFLIFFSISAFYLFSSIPSYTQFSTMAQSFLSLFVLLTTANFPDVMMPAYQVSQFYALFFIVFLVINLYFLLNIMLAVVYNSFSQIEKEKFRKLFIHRRKACDQAFRLLVTNKNVEYIEFKHFNGLLQQLKPESTLTERFLMFKALILEVFVPPEERQTSKQQQQQQHHHSKLPAQFSQQPPMNTLEYIENMIHSKEANQRRFVRNHVLTLDKFYYIYEVLNLRWQNLDHHSPWFDPCFARVFMYKLRAFVLHRYFELFSYCIIIMAALYQFIDALVKWDANHIHQTFYSQTSSKIICAVFIALYTIEMLLKLLVMGPKDYFHRWWNRFDCLITMVAIITFILNQFDNQTTLSTSVFSLRSLKLLEFLRQNVARYRDILGPVALIIIKRFMSVTIVVLIVYYFFAIIAMECFGQYSLKDCCVNTTLEPYYRSNGTITSFYFLNNFQDLTSSYITLFELMVVNNWQILMQAYVIVTQSSWTYLFFIAFYIITLVVITIVLAFVLDTFNFHMQYKSRFGADGLMSVKILVEIPLTQQEFNHCQALDYQHRLRQCCRPSPRLFPCSEMFLCGSNRYSMFAGRTPKLQDSTNSQPIDTMVINTGADGKDFETIVPTEPGGSTTFGSQTATTSKRIIMFRGQKIRDEFSYNLRMNHDKLIKWIEQSEFS